MFQILLGVFLSPRYLCLVTIEPRLDEENAAARLPEPFIRWFAEKGWAPRAHQIELLARAQGGQSVLLIAPTGAGKTLAGFLPSLTELAQRPKRKPGSAHRGIHTLYISPLKALAVDIERNLGKPVAEIGLPVTIETRTGDTPQHKRARQKLVPPDILLTTPEQLALLIASADAARFFADLRYVVFDELHSLVTSKRGHLLALGLARLRKLVPGLQTVGLSATVAEPDELRRWLVSQNPPETMAALIIVEGGAKPDISILNSEERVPWAGHSARYATPEIYDAIKRHKTTLSVRQYAQPGGASVSRTVAGQRRYAADRAAPRLARCRPAPARGKGDGRQCAARHRRHVDARSRHRLGGRRSGRPCRRAEGCQPAGAAHRPLQPPDGRTVEGDPNPGKPLRGAGVPGGARRQLSRRAGHAAADRRRARRVGATRAGLRLCRAVRGRRPVSGNTHRRPLRRSRPAYLRPRRRFRRHRRLCAEKLRALRPHPTEQGRAVARDASARRPAIPAERRHHHRGAGAQRALCEGRIEGVVLARRHVAGQDRGGVSRNADAWRHVPVRRQGAALRRHPRERMLRVECARQRCQGALLRRRQVSAVDLSGRPGARHAGRSGPLEAAAGTGRRLAAHPGGKVGAAQARKPA